MDRHNPKNCDCKEGTIPLCPDIKFQETPNYEVTDVIIKPTVLVNQEDPGIHLHKTFFTFNLTPSQAAEIADLRDEEDVAFPSMKLLLRFCALNMKKAEQVDLYPPGLGISICEKKIVLNPKTVAIHAQPFDVSKHVVCSEFTPNTLNVVWLGDPCHRFHYCIALYMTKLKQSPDHLFNKLKLRPSQAADVTRQKIEEIIESMEEEVGGLTSITVSVMCPLAKMRMKFPCRTTFCKHLQCFDAHLFFVMNDGTQNYNCPVCLKDFKFGDMILDEYFIDVLEKLKPDAGDEIELFRDGTWKAKPKKLKHNGVEYVRVQPIPSVLAQPYPDPFTQLGTINIKRAFQQCHEHHGMEWPPDAVVSRQSPEYCQGNFNRGLRMTKWTQVPRESSSQLENIGSLPLTPRSYYNCYSTSSNDDSNNGPSFEAGNNGNVEPVSIVEPNGINERPASSSSSSTSSQETCVGSSQVVPNGKGADPMCVLRRNKRRKGFPCASSRNNGRFVPDPAPAETRSTVAALPLNSESSGNGEIDDGTSFNGHDMSSQSKETSMEPGPSSDDDEMLHLAYEIIFADKATPKETFTLKMSWKSSYFDMATKVGKRVGADPEYIQFFRSYQSKDSPARPMRFPEEDEELLRKLTGVYTPTRGTYKLYYQVLQMPVTDLMNKKRFKVRFYSPQDKGEREVFVWVNKSSRITANDVLLEVSKVMSGDHVMTLRMVKIFQCQITNIVDNDCCADFSYATMSGYYRAEEILSGEGNLSAHEMLIPVAHFNQEVRFTFGVPFLLKVCFGETWLSVKKKIQIRLGLKKRGWSKINMALVSQRSMKYIGPNEDYLPIGPELFAVKTRSTDGFKTWIGLDHPFDGPTELIQ